MRSWGPLATPSETPSADGAHLRWHHRTAPDRAVREAGDGLEAIAQARETVPDVILMDIHMPECDGLEAVRIIKREMPHVHIIMLTVSDDDRDLFTAIKNGAEGYLLKNLEPYQLFDMLEGVRQGEAPISGTLAAKILQEFRRLDQSMVPKPEVRDEVTPREVEVLERVVEGATNGDPLAWII